MRAMWSKHRLVLLISTILLFQAISGFPQRQQTTNDVSYLSTNGKQKRSHTDTKPNEGAHLGVHLSMQSESIIDDVRAQEFKNEAEAKNQRVARILGSVEQRVIKIISEQLGVDVYDVPPDSLLMGDLGADSLDLVELIMTLEDQFEIKIPDEDAKNIKTVQDAIDFIKNHS